MRRDPPDILITTPESLYLMLSSGAREILASAEAVIVDEIHAVAQSKRGSHLALTLERLEWLARKARRRGRDEGSGALQRIGLSATQRPLERIAAFLVGPKRECRIVDAGSTKELDLEIVVPVEDMSDPGAAAPPDVPGRPADGTPSQHDLPRPGRPQLRRRLEPRSHLAGDLPRAAATGPRAHLDDRLRQQPPRRRAPGQAPQRARQRAARAGAAGHRAGGTRPGDAAPAGEEPIEIARAHHGSLAARGADRSSRSC